MKIKKLMLFILIMVIIFSFIYSFDVKAELQCIPEDLLCRTNPFTIFLPIIQSF
jgi:hypothetical protein